MKTSDYSLGSLTEANVEKHPPSGEGDFTYVDISSIDRATKRIVAPSMIPVSEAPSRARQVLKAGDVLVSMTRPNLNAVAIVPAELDGSIGSTGFHVLRAKTAEPLFIYYAVQTTAFIDAMCQKVQGALYPAVRPKDISSFFLPPFPLSQQRRIVAEIEKQFSRLDEGVSALKRVQANLKRYRAAVLKAACEGKLVENEVKRKKEEGRSLETGDQLLQRILAERRQKWQGRGKYTEPVAPDTSNLPELPDGWTWCMSDALFSFITSGSRGWAEYYSETGPLFLRIGNLDHENIRLDLSELQHVKPPTGTEGVRTGVQANDILISITADVGMVSLVPDGLGEAYINQHVALARPLQSISPTYVAYYLCSSEGGWGYLKKLQRGATKVGLGLGDIRVVPIPLPPLAEQERIVAEVERRLSVIDELESVVTSNLRRADRLRQAVLQKAFTGDLA